MDENMEIKYEISPKFNLIYEFGMPTGKKIRSDLVILIIFIILSVLSVFYRPNIKEQISMINNGSILNIARFVCIIASIIVLIKFIIDIIFQYLQYKHIEYKFYENIMIYEDDFLNQHRKTIEYKNIKEIEIRRTIWDRLFNYGVIIIHTNAENFSRNGIIIYGLNNPKYHYDIIYNIIHSNNSTNNII